MSDFPFDVEIPVADFLRLPMGEFSPQNRNGRVYYHGRLPSLRPTPCTAKPGANDMSLRHVV